MTERPHPFRDVILRPQRDVDLIMFDIATNIKSLTGFDKSCPFFKLLPLIAKAIASIELTAEKMKILR